MESPVPISSTVAPSNSTPPSRAWAMWTSKTRCGWDNEAILPCLKNPSFVHVR